MIELFNICLAISFIKGQLFEHIYKTRGSLLTDRGASSHSLPIKLVCENDLISKREKAS